MVRPVLFCVSVVAFLASQAAAASAWTQLKAGMTRGEAAAVLGNELMASRGRGFEVAIYDDKAEAIFLRGKLVAWTAPANVEAAPSPENAWQFEQSSRPRPSAVDRAAPNVRTQNRAILPAYRL